MRAVVGLLALAAAAAWVGGAGAAPAASPGAAASAVPSARPTGAGAEGCTACHLETGDDRLATPAKAFPEDVHAAKGFGCVACHGGDARAEGMEAMDPRKGYIGVPKRRQIVQLCARCHSDARFMKQYNPSVRVDQAAEYATSVHGRRLAAGDARVAVCTSCHPAHSIRPPSDPRSSVHPLKVAETCGACHADAKYMATYGIATDQLQKYRQSVHRAAMSVKGDLSAPTCNDCHGNHGAAPPGVSWVGNVCGQCHTVMAELFGRSVHARAFTQMGTPGCATCHENHEVRAAGDAMLGVGEGAVCAACHSADDPGGKAAALMRARIDGLSTEVQAARALLLRAEHAGMEVSQAQFDLKSADDALIKARASVHAFVPQAVVTDADAGLPIAAKAHARGVRALEELRFRRTGLAISVVVIAALVAGLLMKIRQIDRRRASGTGP